MIAVRPHEELLAANKLTIYDESKGKALFVSHEWVGKAHPDPEFDQFRIMQDALKNIWAGLSKISVDIVSEAVFGINRAVSAEELQSEPLFIWYDYFSCPQLHSNCDDQAERLQSRHQLDQAIRSIPAYISQSRLFMALCPVVASPDHARVVSHFSWAQRGWCRVEKAIRELSSQAGWILVKSARHQEIIASLTVEPPGEGDFTLEEDRGAVAPVLQRVLRNKLEEHLRSGNMVGYRILLNQQRARLRGLSIDCNEEMVPGFEPDPGMKQHELVLAKFLFHSGFSHPRERDAGGVRHRLFACDDLLKQDKNLGLSLSLHWAAMGTCGSARTMGFLICRGADLNEQYRPSMLSPMGALFRVKGLQHKPKKVSTQLRRLGYHHYGATPLMFAILSGNYDAAAVLVANGARLDIKNSRNKTAEDLAQEMSAPGYLMDAFGGNTSGCISMSSLVLDEASLDESTFSI